MALIEYLLAGIQYLLPHHLLSRLVHAFMRAKTPWLKNSQIGIIASFADVDWSESRLKKPEDFETFNDFFTRELEADARLPDPDPKAFISPSDGKISECGRVKGGRILQAKGAQYSLQILLAGDPCVNDLN